MRKREIHLNCLKGITSFWDLSLWHSYWYSVNRTLSSIQKAELFRLSKLEINFNGWITNSENSQVAVYWKSTTIEYFSTRLSNHGDSKHLFVRGSGRGGVWLVSTLGLKVRDIGAAVPLLLPGGYWDHCQCNQSEVISYTSIETTGTPMFNFPLEPIDSHLSILSFVNKIHKLYTVVKSINFNHYQLFTVFRHFKNLTPCLIDLWQVFCVLR